MNIENAIQFVFNMDEFVSSSRHVVHKGCTDDIERKIKHLKEIEEKFEGGELPLTADFHHALLKFRLGVKKGNPREFIDSPKLFRRLAYSLNLPISRNRDEIVAPIVCSIEETKAVLSLLSSNWKDSYLLGLLSALLSAWENDNQEPVDLLRQFTMGELSSYEGSRKILCSAKHHSTYFDVSDGNIELGTWLSLHKISLYKINSFLGFPKTWISKAYFSKVIDAYFDKIRNDTSKYEDFLSLLELHDNTISYKRILSKMIIQLEYDADSDIAISVKKITFDKIGDSIINAKWAAPKTFTNKEKETLLAAQTILNRWVTSQFISIFFEKCINDHRRKKFWAEKAKYVDRFKIIGPREIFRDLKTDDRVSAFVESRYSIAPSIKDISAIIMHIGDLCIIEFSDSGYATQIFEKNKSDCPSIDIKVYDSAEDLRNGQRAIISTKNDYLADRKTKNGRLFHRGNWEIVYNQFLDKHVLKNQ